MCRVLYPGIRLFGCHFPVSYSLSLSVEKVKELKKNVAAYFRLPPAPTQINTLQRTISTDGGSLTSFDFSLNATALLVAKNKTYLEIAKELANARNEAFFAGQDQQEVWATKLHIGTAMKQVCLWCGGRLEKFLVSHTSFNTMLFSLFLQMNVCSFEWFFIVSIGWRFSLRIEIHS